MHPASDSPPPPAPADRQLQALKDLVAHLSAQPMHDIRQAGELADRFGLDQTMVERILVDLDQPVQRSGVWENLWRIFSSAVLELARSLRSIVARWTDRPWPAILVSSAMAILALTLDVRLAAGPGSEGQRLFNNSALAVLALGSLVVQAITLARHGSQKLAVFSSGLIFVGLIHPMTVALRIQAPQGTGSIPILGIAASYALALTMAHLIFSSGISAIGAWARLQKAERRIRRLSRQEMLDRLFRLDRHLGEAVARKSGRRPGFKEWMRESRTFPAAGMALGVGFGLLEVALVGGALAAAGPSPGARAFLAQFLAALLTLIWLLACGGLAYASGSVMRGMIVGLSAAGIRMMIHSIPVQPYGLDQMVASLRDGRQVLQLGLLLLAATIAGAAGMVDRRQSRRERLASRDPASLAAEMVLLHRRLSGEGRDAAILAVDVARSTALKAAADPLDVEYSFREYQALVARTVQEAGGEVFATAGDGALASLPSAEAALLAARTIQTRINRFNQEINRLRDFRLRIGLHAGSSAADFGATQHHELIDIAAHTEGMAPVGGIAATEAFRSRITAEEMAEINAEVDGHKVFIVLRPILEE